MNRDRLLKQWAAYLATSAQPAQLTTDPCPIVNIQPIAGPRAGALEILAGLHAGDLLRALRRHDSAPLQQFVPWKFQGDPQVHIRGRHLRVEPEWSNVFSIDKTCLWGEG